MTAAPWGFRDILPDQAQAREDIAQAVREHFKGSGYRPIETPLLEDQTGLYAGGRAADTPFRLFDDDGRFLVVRPDNTLPIVRIVRARMAAGDLPLRLRYEAPVVRAAARDAGATRQFTQLGFELIGVSAQQGDAEAVRLVAGALAKLGVPGWRIVCGSVRPFRALLEACGDAELAERALADVHANDFVDLDAHAAAADLPESMRRAICALPRVAGGVEALDRVDALLEEAGVDDSATAELRALHADACSDPAMGGALSFDFSLMGSFDYYTGLVFKAYAAGASDPVGSGGRYDRVFDGALGARGVPAAGFAFSLERLERALGEAGGPVSVGAEPASAAATVASASASARRPLRIAVPKGSLKEGTVRALDAAGFDASAFVDAGRHLIVGAPDRAAAGTAGDLGTIELVIVRAQDAPAFVACGGADCGICGRDSLIEAGLDVLQLAELGFGGCRFIEAEPAASVRAQRAERSYARTGVLRVATKYPRIARAWYERRGVNAEIVSLHGNIELGPIVGMADRIVDITATGTTLRENDLVVTGELMECTARLFVNPGRARTDARVRELVRRLIATGEE